MVEIKTPEEFEKWLEKQPTEVAQVMETRISLRTLPVFALTIDEIDISWKLLLRILIQQSVKWALNTCPNRLKRKVTKKTPIFVQATTNLLKVIDETIDITINSKTAAIAAAATTVITPAPKIFRIAQKAISLAFSTENINLSPADACSTILNAIKHDILYLEEGATYQKLVVQPLWMEEAPNEFQNYGTI